MSAYGFDDEGEREHDCCFVCGSGSCPGSGSGGDDACTYGRRRPAPPLSPEEREIVERFETAADPYADDREAFLQAAREAAWFGRPEGECPEPDSGEHLTRDGVCLLCGAKAKEMVHCFSGFGSDWSLDSVLDCIRTAREVEWVNGFCGHDLRVVDDEGRLRAFDVVRPADGA